MNPATSSYIDSVNGPVHTGQGDINIHNSNTGRCDVEPGETRTRSVFHTRINNFEEPILIGDGLPKRPTTVKGDIAGWEVRLGNFAHVIGDVYGVTSVEVKSRCLIEGNVFGEHVYLGSECYVTRNIFAKHLALGSAGRIYGHIFCDHLMSDTRTTPTVLIDGLFFCGHDLAVPDGVRFSRLICLGDIQIGKNAMCYTLISSDTVTLLEGSAALVVKCKNLIMERGAKVGTALVSQTANIGAECEIGFLDAGGISNIGHRTRFHQTTLLSPCVRTEIADRFWLGARPQIAADGFAVQDGGTLTIDQTGAVGLLFTQLLSHSSLQIGARLAREKLLIVI